MTRIASALDTLERYEHRLINDVFAEHGPHLALAAYAFVFGYYGFLKLQVPITGLSTPVRGEVGHLVEILGLPEAGISLTAVMVFIGPYGLALGAPFAFKELRLALPVFLNHQAARSSRWCSLGRTTSRSRTSWGSPGCSARSPPTSRKTPSSSARPSCSTRSSSATATPGRRPDGPNAPLRPTEGLADRRWPPDSRARERCREARRSAWQRRLRVIPALDRAGSAV